MGVMKAPKAGVRKRSVAGALEYRLEVSQIISGNRVGNLDS
jgi:hypothetical protein